MTYDYIIVGAGSAGCVLANRLSADPAKRVLLLEAGPRDWHPLIHMPAGLAKLVNRKGINWDYYTEPETHLDNRRLWWPRGKVLGGSSSINAMCYIRGDARDYDEWAQIVGDARWNFEHVLECFKRAENNSRGADALHGADGLLNVQDLRYINPLSQTFVDAAVACGYPRNPDFNGTDQTGFGLYQVTQRNGARCSTAAGYLRASTGRSNLRVITRATTRQIALDGNRAIGVDYRHRGKSIRALGAQIIICGGAINSPQLLMLSGIGPADHLREHGLTCVVDSPCVGANLQDHLDICTLQHCNQPISYDQLNELGAGLRYLFKRDGPATSNLAEGGGFVRTQLAPDARCDVQFHFIPALLNDHGRQRMPGYGFTLHACGLRPRSRGTIRLASADADARALIHANYLSDSAKHDLRTLVEALKLSRNIFASTPYASVRGNEVLPGAACVSDDDLRAYIRRKAETVYHPVGTCRMGNDDDAVVDTQLRVRGVDGLRVVDASVMPCLPGGNTNAPTIMIAEQAAQFIVQV